MYRFIAYFLISFAYSFNLLAVEIGYGIEDDQTVTLNKLRGQSIFTIEAAANKVDYSAQLNKSGINGTLNLKVNDIEKTNGEYKLDISDIINEEYQKNYTVEFLPLIEKNQIILNIKKLKDAEIAEKDDVVKRLNIHATAVTEIIINEESETIEYPVNLIFLKESTFTKKRGEGHIVSLRGAFELDLKDFISDLEESSPMTISFNFEGNSK